MGIIQKQTLKGALYSYIGVGVGFITTALLFPRILSADEIGLVNILISFSVLFAQLASLGFNGVIGRLFPYFRNQKNGHNGFLLVSLAVTLLGFILVYISFEIFKPVFIKNNAESSPLFVEYINYIIPLIFFTLFFNLFDSYNKAIYDAILGTFIKELVQRVFILLSLLLYFFNLISVHFFIQLYVISVSLPALIIILVLIYRKEFKISLPKKEFYDKKMIREMINLSLFGIISGFGALTILHIDRILVNKFLGLSATGVYATNFFFATLILIPSRALIKISTTIIADSWKSKNLENILFVYKKSVINQGFFSMLIFIGLWINISNIYHIIPIEYSSGKWVIFFVGLANIFQMISGVSGTIITTSKHFRIHTYFILIFVACIVGSNYILIPKFGITGAAIATTISSLIFNLLRMGYVYIKFGMNPFDSKIIILCFLAIGSYFLGTIIPEFNSYIIDIIIRSTVVSIIYIGLAIILNISDDLNQIILKLFKQK